jgi:hypothetical protein
MPYISLAFYLISKYLTPAGGRKMIHHHHQPIMQSVADQIQVNGGLNLRITTDSHDRSVVFFQLHGQPLVEAKDGFIIWIDQDTNGNHLFVGTIVHGGFFLGGRFTESAFSVPMLIQLLRAIIWPSRYEMLCILTSSGRVTL